jgi:lauroyl/myristoyl acyltransferase
MLLKLQNWLMNVAAKWIWIAIMFPIRCFLGLCYAIAKHMPEKVELPYEIRRKDKVSKGWL